MKRRAVNVNIQNFTLISKSSQKELTDNKKKTLRNCLACMHLRELFSIKKPQTARYGSLGFLKDVWN